MSKRSWSPWSPTHWDSLAALVLTAITLIFIITNQLYLVWVRGVIYTSIFMVVIWGVIKLVHARMTKSMQAIFVIGCFFVGWGFMNQGIQQMITPVIGFQVAPLGLVDTAGQVLMSPLTLGIVLIAILGFGLWRTSSTEEVR